MFLFFVWFIFWYLDRENAFPKIMLKLWSLCFHADVLSVLILNRRSFQFFSARNVSWKDMLGNHSVKHAWKSVFIISGVTFFFFFFFQFRQCGFRDAYQSCVHALIPALARTWFVTTFRHYWSICLSVLSVPCGCQNFSRLAKSWSPFLQTRVNLWIWCCTVLQVFFHLRGHLTISLSVIEISYRNGPEIMHRRMHSSHFKCLSMQCPQLLWLLRCAP